MAITRREFLKSAAATIPVVMASAPLDHAVPACNGVDGASALESLPKFRTPSTIDRYIDPLPIPPVLLPRKGTKDGEELHVRMMECAHRLHSQLPPARVWSYEGHYPGPTIEAACGHAVEIEWYNLLPSEHLFEIDETIHGAMPPAPAVRTVPHLHGASAPSGSDGLPEKWFISGTSVRYRYPNQQAAATLWYHDHAIGITRLNLYAGLSGFYLLRDPQEQSMNLPSGEFEIPLVIQDRTLDEGGQLVYAPAQEGGGKLPPRTWGPQLFGDLPVINGAIYPFCNVEPRSYRLRILNAANARFFNLYLNLAHRPTDIPNLVSFHQIGSDCGFLAQPVAMRQLLIAPAERADLIVDFSGLDGKTVTLMNDARAPYPGWNQLHSIYPPLGELMQFRVVLPVSDLRTKSRLPQPYPLPRIDPEQCAVTRDFVLTEAMNAEGMTIAMKINNKGYADPITEFPKLGTVEKWRFVNMTDDTHPMHLHLAQFQVLERQGFNYEALLQGKLELLGSRRPAAPNEAGWKDTAIVNPRDVLTILVKFSGYTGRYVYHCHMAEHEDNDMMRPYEVIT